MRRHRSYSQCVYYLIIGLWKCIPLYFAYVILLQAKWNIDSQRRGKLSLMTSQIAIFASIFLYLYLILSTQSIYCKIVSPKNLKSHNLRSSFVWSSICPSVDVLSRYHGVNVHRLKSIYSQLTSFWIILIDERNRRKKNIRKLSIIAENDANTEEVIEYWLWYRSVL